MNAPIDPKNVTPVKVTTGSLPGSRKVYIEAEGRPDIRIPFREIALHESSGEPSFRVYDTSGPYSDETARIDVNEGLPRLRVPWVKARAVEQYAGREVKPEDNGNVGAAHLAREFPARAPSTGLPRSWRGLIRPSRQKKKAALHILWMATSRAAMTQKPRWLLSA